MATNPKQKDVKIVLHWLEKSRSQRILWLFEELKLEYELKLYKRGKDMRAGADLKNVHPLGKSPVITVTVPGTKPRVIAESALIVEYLTEFFGKELIPTQFNEGHEGQIGQETEAWERYRFWMHYAEGSLMPPLLIIVVARMIKESADAPFFIKPITRAIGTRLETMLNESELKTHFDFVEEQLKASGGDFLCGNQLTGADILMIFPLESSKATRGARYPLIDAYVERIAARDAYKKAVQKIVDMTGKFERF